MPLKPPHRRRNQMNASAPFKTGDRIRAIGHFGRHSYQPGSVYTVTTVDCNDSTLKARDQQGEEGNWIKWADCQKFSDIGWDWLKTVLPAQALDLLSAFDGLEQLTLREEIRNRLVLQIPALHEKILSAHAAMEADAPAPGKGAADGEGAEENDADFADMLADLDEEFAG
jgi:hypothetical protein